MGINIVCSLGDYFGELMFVEEDKDFDKNDYMVEAVSAATALYTLELDKYALKNLMLNDDELQMKMEIIIRARIAGCWEAIESNEMLSTLSVSQKTVLQSVLVQQRFVKGEVICVDMEASTGESKLCQWSKGETPEFAVLIQNGDLAFDEIHGANNNDEDGQLPPLSTGMLLFDYRGTVSNEKQLKTTLRCASESAVVFTIERDHFDKFLESNPLVLLGLFHSEVLP